MPWIRFYLRWLSKTFRGTVGVAMTAVGVMTLIAGALYDLNVLEREVRVGWLIGAACFVVVLVWRFLAAPYWIYREQDEELRRLHDQHGGRRRVTAFKALLGAAEQRGRKLLLEAPGDTPRIKAGTSERAALEWAEETGELIRRAAGEGESLIFMSDAGETFFSGAGKIKNFIDGRLRKIVGLIQRADTLTLEPDFDPDEFGDGGAMRF